MTTTMRTKKRNVIATEEAQWFQDSFDVLVENVSKVLVGKSSQIELAFIAVIARGHLLIEDCPGTGKTSLAKAMAQSIGGESQRIQFTADLLPSDITGVTVYDQKESKFLFHAGPVFANVVLADEINRASPKAQSALLEVMEEGKVTVDGRSHPVGEPFTVIATQNPIEQAGTYSLPEAQLDRFLIKTSLGYPDIASTISLLRKPRLSAVSAVMNPQQMVQMSNLSEIVHCEPSIADYVSRLVEATRNAVQVRLGSSVRGAIGLMRVARVKAASQGRKYVIPDDVKHMAEVVLAHRMLLKPEYEFEGLTAQQVVRQILLDVQPPTSGTV